MKNSVARGQSKLPRINFEVPEKIKEAVIKKCHIEGTTQRTIGIGLFKEWLAMPAVPEDDVHGN